MDLEDVLDGESNFGFLQKRRFTARQSVAEIRSKSHVQLKPESDNYIWNRKPPDFTPKLYISSATYAEKMVWKNDKDFKQAKISRKVIFPDLVLKKRTSNFVCRFKIIDPFESKIMFVKTGKYEHGAYKDPKPHDFRQYEAGIPNFVTSFGRDPFTMKFESGYLKTVHERLSKVEQKNGLSAQVFDTYKPEELKWDSQLILTKEHWPPRPASYTRHRRSRDAYSAFMDRVEEKVTKLWQKISFHQGCYNISSKGIYVPLGRIVAAGVWSIE